MICLECSKEFIGSRERKFCSSSCSAKCNNKNRRHTEKTKSKIAKGVENYRKSFGPPKPQKNKYCKLNISYAKKRSTIRKVWWHMVRRCHTSHATNFMYYGEKGICVCCEWHVFENFYYDMHTTWFPGASIDRINSNGNYEPTNCRWLTKSQNFSKVLNHRL